MFEKLKILSQHRLNLLRKKDKSMSVRPIADCPYIAADGDSENIRAIAFN